MTRRTAVVVSLVVLAAFLVAWAAIGIGRRWATGPRVDTSAGQPAATPPAPERKIKATLYYVSGDGLSLVATERDVPFAEPIVTQARRIVEAQLDTPPAPLASPIPAGTTLRSLFMTERGDAFVDLSAEVTSRHPGGALNELFTVYAIVDALTVNLPAITRVQLLVDGKEVDTLAGHVDLRHPLQKNLKWLATAASPPAENR